MTTLPPPCPALIILAVVVVAFLFLMSLARVSRYDAAIMPADVREDTGEYDE